MAQTTQNDQTRGFMRKVLSRSNSSVSGYVWLELECRHRKHVLGVSVGQLLGTTHCRECERNRGSR